VGGEEDRVEGSEEKGVERGIGGWRKVRRKGKRERSERRGAEVRRGEGEKQNEEVGGR